MESRPVDSTDQISRPDQTVAVSSFARSPRPPLLPDSFKHPFVLIWVAILPQLVLLLLNLRNYQLVSGEMTSWQGRMAGIIGVCQLLLLGSVALVVIGRARKRILPCAACWVLLAAPILYLWLVMYQIGALLPASVTAWILRPDQVLYDQFAFMMPLIFYAAIRLACVDLNISRRVDYGISSLIAVGVPLFFFGLLRMSYAWRLFAHIPTFVFATLVTIGTVAMTAALLRLLVTAYLGVRRKGPVALAILCFLVGIAGPIGGLLLNRKIPFPADFQALPVYVIAAVNGALLLLPNFANASLHRIVWLAQCVLFPFTFYFFLVFLPFLPLSIPAILVAGAGFLILTPTALFLVHGQRIFDGYRSEIRDARRLKPAILALIALSILPGIYAIEAGIDRVILRQAIDYVYSPNYRTDTRFTGNTAFVRHSLLHLRDFKAGLELPFLSRFYNWAVFGGLVLPDEKMNHIYRAFFGQELPQPPPGAIGVFGNAPARQALFRETRTAPPHDAVLTKATAGVVSEGNCDRATILLEMHNPTHVQSEFVTSIHLPEGVLVSGFWLHIGDQRVPGQLFEKKSALWVYQMIRDRTRRDPGLLLYTDPHTLELRVFPLDPDQQRQVEIEFFYPTALKPVINIGNEVLRPSGDSPSSGIVVTQTAEGEAAVWIAPSALSSLPKTSRVPYLHFIVDRSAGSQITNESLADVIRATRAQFPEARDCLVTAANYETADLTNELTPLDSMAAIDFQSVRQRGGFLAERAIKRALLRYHDALNDAATNNAWFGKFPVFIVLRDNHTANGPDDDLSAFAGFVPDIAGYYVITDGGSLAARAFSGESVAGRHPIKPVTLLKLGNSVALLATNEEKAKLVDFDGSTQQDELTAFDSGKDAFVPVGSTEKIHAQSRYSAGIAAWQDYLALIFNPSLGSAGLTQTVKRSRESGVLVASTSYIVVENSAQWKVLERKQNQKLRNSVALEVEAVPEPSTWCLILLGGTFLLLCHRQTAKATLRRRLHGHPEQSRGIPRRKL